MRIALDFDDTVTRDPDLWRWFVARAKSRNHDIRIVTFRSDNRNNDDIDAWNDFNIPVIFTGGKTKRKACYQQDFYVDVWIDDMPEIIVTEEETANVPFNLIQKVISE